MRDNYPVFPIKSTKIIFAYAAKAVNDSGIFIITAPDMETLRLQWKLLMPDIGKKADGTDVGETGLVPETHRICGRVEFAERSYQENPDPESEIAFTIDGSGYFGALCVTTDFGCNLHEPQK